MRKQLTFFTMLFDVTCWAVWWACGRSAVRVGIGWMDAGHCRYLLLAGRCRPVTDIESSGGKPGSCWEQPIVCKILMTEFQPKTDE